MRLALVSSNFRPHVGGIERFVEILAGGLAASGHEVHVACCRFAGAPLNEELDGFAIHRIRSSYVLDRRLNVPIAVPEPLSMVRQLRKLVAAADVVHVQDTIYATSLPALALARQARVPSVLTQHVAFVPQGSGVLDVAQRAAQSTLGRCARLATVVATYNPAVAEWVGDRWGIPDVRVLPVGVRDHVSTQTREALRRSFDLPADRFVAVFVGRDVPKKGLRHFLGASDPAFELVAVTDRRKPAEGASILPFMQPERLQELLACADAFVLPSEAEGFPLALQEALVKGLPVVIAWQPGYERYLARDDAIVVDRDADSVRNALLRLAGDANLRASLSRRARAAGQRSFGVARFVSAYEAAYAEAREIDATRR